MSVREFDPKGTYDADESTAKQSIVFFCARDYRIATIERCLTREETRGVVRELLYAKTHAGMLQWPAEKIIAKIGCVLEYWAWEEVGCCYV